MGRGRAKAKQTKVARRLKYNAPQTDLDALRQELAGANPGSHSDHDQHDSDDYEYGDYDKYADYEYDDEDDDDDTSHR